MPTNARIERLLREVEGVRDQPVESPRQAMRGVTKVVIGVVAIGAVVGAIAASQAASNAPVVERNAADVPDR